MRRFNAPPGWPPPPNVRWRPPKGWVPHETWPPAPPDWSFWVNENGRRVLGPIGRYGGAGVLLALVLLVSWGPFSAGGGNPVAGRSSVAGDDSTSQDPGSSDSAVPSDGMPTDGSTAFPSTTVPPGSPTDTPSATPSGSPTTIGIPTPTVSPSLPVTIAPTTLPTGTASIYYKNCGAVKAAGAAPLLRGEPGYRPELDPDGDGVACDKGR